jgi:hypothetical protein
VPVPNEIDSANAPGGAHDPSLEFGASPSSAALLAQMQPGKADEIGSAFRLPIRPNVRFFLAHTPEEWDPEPVKGTVAGVELDGVFWLPGVAPRVLEPGAALIRTRGQQEPVEATYQHAMEVSRREGWVWLDPVRHIPAECLPPGVPAGGYWRTMPCIDPRTRQVGDYHFEVWKLPAETLPGRRQRFDYHRPSFNLWRAWLVLTGQVKPPLDFLLESIRGRMAERVERARALPLPDTALARTIAAAEAREAVYVDAKVPAKAVAAASPRRGSK